MIPSSRLAFAVAALLLASMARAADPPAELPQADLAACLTPIRRQLASADYPQREAGQRELDKISPVQVDALRTLAAAESDPEVKARLEARVATMELYNLIHPPGLSLDVANATLDQVAAALNGQLGGPLLQVAGAAAAGRQFTLHADKQPFWQILEQLNRQSPLNIASGASTVTAAGMTTFVRIDALPGGAAPRPLALTDTFAHIAQAIGQAATGAWTLRVQFFADPRVRVAQYSMLRIDKISDQDGHNLLPLLVATSTSLNTVARPVNSWSSSASLRAAPGVQRLAAVRGNVALALVEHEQVATLDLTQPNPQPLPTARGLISADKNAAGNWVLHVTPTGQVPPAPAALGPLNILNISVLDREGRLISSSATTGSQLTLTVSRAGMDPAKVQLTWIDKLRDMTLPFVLQDVELPPPGVANPAVGRGVLILPAQ